jgi:hypothetical protein
MVACEPASHCSDRGRQCPTRRNSRSIHGGHIQEEGQRNIRPILRTTACGMHGSTAFSRYGESGRDRSNIRLKGYNNAGHCGIADRRHHVWQQIVALKHGTRLGHHMPS